MANNPFYPGYVPDPKNPVQPFYPGYFPGQAKTRLPKPTKFIQPIEFGADKIVEFINAFDYGYKGEGAPKWVIDQMVDDFKQQFKSQMKPSAVSAEDMEDIDVNALPGAYGVNIDLDPTEWAKDPKKKLVKTLEGWGKGAINLTDFDNRIKSDLWRRMTYQDVTSEFPLEELTAMHFGGRMAAGEKDLSGYTTTGNPIALRGFDVTAETPVYDKKFTTQITTSVDPLTGNVTAVSTTQLGTYNPLDKLAYSVEDLQRKVNTVALREGAYDTVAVDALHAASALVEQQRAAITGRPAGEIFSNFNKKVELVDHMQWSSKTYSDMQTDIEKAMMGSGIGLKGVDLLYKDSTGKETLKSAILDYDKALKATMDRLDAITAGGPTGLVGIDPREAAKWEKFLTPVREHLESMQNDGVMRLARDFNGGRITEAELNAALSGINAKEFWRRMETRGRSSLTGSGIGTGDVFSKSFVSRLSRYVLNDEINGPTRTGASARIWDVMQELDIDQRWGIRVFTKEARQERIVAGMREVTSALGKGPEQVFENYVWKRVTPLLKGYTPAYYSEKLMKKTMFLGLQIEDDARFEKSIYYVGGRKGLLDAPSGVAANTFGLNYREFTVDPITGKQTLGTGVIRATGIFGGSHFGSIRGLDTLMKDHGWNEQSINYLVHHLTDVRQLTDSTFDPAFLAHLATLNGTPGNLALHVSGKPLHDFAVGIMGGVDSKGKTVAGLRAWLAKHDSKIKSNVSKTDDKYLVLVIKALRNKDVDPDYKIIGITKRYSGLMQKLYYNLNKLQTQLMKRVGKIIAPAMLWKKLLSEFIAEGVTKLIAALSGAASGGILAAVTEFLKPVIRFVVEKTTDFITGFVGGLLKGDFFAVFDSFEKTLYGILKVVLIIVGIPMLFVIIMDQSFMGAVATTVSPVDSTRGSGDVSYFSGTGGGGGGGGVVNPVPKPSPVISCFTFVDADPPNKWPDGAIDFMNASVLPVMQTYLGGYVTRLCAAGNIDIIFEQNRTGAYTYSTSKIAMGGADNQFVSSWTNILAYLLTHETGHVYSGRVGMESFVDSNSVTWSYTKAMADDGGRTLPTYTGGTGTACSYLNNASEDFAETIGDWVYVHASCNNTIYDGKRAETIDAGFWGRHQGHWNYADKVLTRP